jgi:hypothetical protein
MVESDAFCKVSFRTHVRTFVTLLSSACVFCDFYSKMSEANAFVIHIAAVLLLCYCKQNFMAIDSRIIL